ncbi:hypothetical protein KI387_019529, partial [Taxus chinensis]
MGDATVEKPAHQRSAKIGMFDPKKCFSGHEIKSVGGVLTAAIEEDVVVHNINKQHRAFQLLIRSISSAVSCSSKTSDNASNWSYSSSDVESMYRATRKYSAKMERHSEKGRRWAS